MDCPFDTGAYIEDGKRLVLVLLVEDDDGNLVGEDQWTDEIVTIKPSEFDAWVHVAHALPAKG